MAMKRSPRQSRFAPLLAILAVVVMTLAACANYPSFNELGGDLDKLAIPQSWRLASTLANGPGGDVECVPHMETPDCPQLVRYYVATGSPEEAYQQGERTLLNAGFALDALPGGPCSLRPGRAVCTTDATAGDQRVWLRAFPADYDFTEIDIEDRSGPIVVISMWREWRDS
jgi:hypothetical protein